MITRYTLSFAHSDTTQEFICANAAGRAFGAADAALAPRVIASDGRSARTIARTVRIEDVLHKSIPPLTSLPAGDETFWLGVHTAPLAAAA